MLRSFYSIRKIYDHYQPNQNCNTSAHKCWLLKLPVTKRIEWLRSDGMYKIPWKCVINWFSTLHDGNTQLMYVNPRKKVYYGQDCLEEGQFSTYVNQFQPTQSDVLVKPDIVVTITDFFFTKRKQVIYFSCNLFLVTRKIPTYISQSSVRQGGWSWGGL